MSKWDSLSAFGLGGGCRCHRGEPAVDSFGGDAATKHYPPDLELEPVHLAIEMSLDLANQEAQISVNIDIIAHAAGVKTLTLDGVDFFDLAVEDVNNGPLRWKYSGEKIEVTWAKPFTQGERRTARVTYRVEKPVAGLYFMKPTASDPDKSLYVATDHETERARHWLACVDLPSVRTTLEFKITAPKDLTILANGSLLSERVHANGTKTAHWWLDQRCPSYLVCLAVGEFVRFDDAAFEGMPVAYFCAKDFTPKDLERSFGRTGTILKWMTAKLALPFPFPKYFQFALPEFSGAMENISLVSWSDRFLVNERAEGELKWLTDQVNVHEMAHSYFGDLVVCRDYAHAWLKESWATYMETCWLEDSKGRDEQHYDLYSNAQAYFEEADQHYARPLVTRRFSSSWQMYDRHLYPGGACRLHTLRCELGDSVFWNGVRDYLKTYSQKTVETDDFRRILEKHSGRSLQKFFDQWVHSPLYPQIKVTFSYDEERRLGTFTVEQTQTAEKSEGGKVRAETVPFELSVELGWTIDGEDARQKVRLTGAHHSFQIQMAKDPEQVRFDPGFSSLLKLDFDPGETRLKQQLLAAKDVIGRIHAAKKLCESGKGHLLQAVVDAYRKEAFWGVKREMAKALADSQSPVAVQGLVGLIGDEKDPMVLASLFRAAGEVRDGAMRDALARRLRSGALPPAARAAILTALGNQRDEAPLATLEAAAKESEPQYGVEQSAALAALGSSGKREAVQSLLLASRPGMTPFRARAGAFQGLAAMAKYAESGVRVLIEERMIDGLRDPDPLQQAQAAKAIAAAKVKEAVPALEAYRGRLSHQERVAIDAIIKSLRHDSQAPAKAITQQVDELQAKLRKLTERLQLLEDNLERKQM